MKDGFKIVEYGLELLREEFKKIEGNGFVREFEKYIEEDEILNEGLNLKKGFVFALLFLFSLNIYFIFKNNIKRENKVSNNFVLEEKKVIPQEILVLKDKDSKVKRVAKKKEKEEVKEEKVEGRLPIEETIEFTIEINKIVGLFNFDFKIGEENEEI